MENYLLICSNTKINSLDVSNNFKLRSLYCANNGIESLDVSNNKELVILNCSGNNTRELDLQNCKRLNAIWCDDYKIHLNYNLQFKDNIADEPLSKSDINPQILVDIADKDHYVAGISTSCSNVYEQRFEYLWIAKDTKGFITKIPDWGKNKWIDWKPNKFGNYTILAKIRVDGRADCIYIAESKYEYHPFIKCECQMPYSQVEPGQPGYLIGVESYENPNQSYQYEMQILNCTLLKQGLHAWTYTTGKFTVPEGNVGWCVWNPDYGYYWTLFRIYDGVGNLIDEYCYPFVNAY